MSLECLNIHSSLENVIIFIAVVNLTSHQPPLPQASHSTNSYASHHDISVTHQQQVGWQYNNSKTLVITVAPLTAKQSPLRTAIKVRWQQDVANFS